MTRCIDGAILTLTGYYNYGNVIQRYALQEFLRQNGYGFISYVDGYSSPKAIYQINKSIKYKTPIRAFLRFLRDEKPYWYIPSYGDIYPEARGQENLIKFVNKNIKIKEFDIQDRYRNYIVGSDQVWRNWWGDSPALGYYFFDFINNKDANLISYAASFGKDKINEVMSSSDRKYISEYIKRIPNISVREVSGAALIKNEWNIENVEVVVDPTLLLEASDYTALIDKSDQKYKTIQPIFTYFIGETEGLRSFVELVKDVRRQSATMFRAHTDFANDKMPPVELWLKGFRDAELVLTNSFHGMIFSVINNTEFYVIGRKEGGISRILDFLKEYGLEDRFIEEGSLSKFSFETTTPIEWDNVNARISENKKKSSEWLLRSITKSR